MIDNNKIEEIANELCDYGSLYDSEHRIDGFKKGANWAIKQFLKELWHPAEEEPKEKDKLLMVETGKNEHKYVHFKRSQGCPFAGWKHYVNMVDVTRWLYMDDLFSKEVKNN